VHGSAPDIAGQGVANPLAAVASAAMLARFSLNMENAASDIETAIDSFLDHGYRTGDIAKPDEAGNAVTTGKAEELLLSFLEDEVTV
jgi:3-isopropylmalate dehydrogenase